jgi:hypothetical protein
MGDGKRCKMPTGNLAGHETFRESLAGSGHRGRQISGFGVRVPGGAQKPRSREWPGLLHARRTPFIRRFQPHVSPRRPDVHFIWS